MIPRSDSSRIVCIPHTGKSWQALYADTITDPAELLQLLALPDALLDGACKAASQFGLRIPRSYLTRISSGHPDDPLLRQFLPLGDELQESRDYRPDPVGDIDAMPVEGLLHKYKSRVLLIASSACALHCRYCFRRHFPYSDAALSQDKLADAINYIKNDISLKEVILSGGDPLSLSDEKLSSLINQLEQIKHIKRLRIHTRLPVIIPERITAELLNLFAASNLDIVIVLHINHPNEIDDTLKLAIEKTKPYGITLLNQSVLLKGVNDDVNTLAALSEKLFSHGITPYYLHMLDKVSGASHFEVEEKTALALHSALCEQLSGYLVPKLVREEKGKPYKSPLSL
ncbi:MAG: EF-P beta-lysylation protein EpmB [Gammaproteobacteria bacterium]|nr:EF-P beta-lysylation protein EpmB [Gammaproteobacteria bacterium]MDH5594396.1 EF-P beta-lysylation protein EpmB [Gammaproteobacteria bacterium]MDH5614063.1 EF-P beta-lysylation protein EpmB [Gammaproteobacteria bacterium]